jgi:hypothetical protein
MSFREPQLLLDISVALARYFSSGNEDTRTAVIRALDYEKIPDRDFMTRYHMLENLLLLHKKFPELVTG